MALVTGARPGSGTAVAERLAAADVAVGCGSGREPAGATSSVRRRGVATVGGDVADPGDVEETVAEGALGSVDVPVSNAGIARLDVLLPGGATETGMMIPAGLPEGAREGLSRTEIVAGLAVYPASDDSCHLTGRQIVATQRSPREPKGRSASEGLGTP